MRLKVVYFIGLFVKALFLLKAKALKQVAIVKRKRKLSVSGQTDWNLAVLILTKTIVTNL